MHPPFSKQISTHGFRVFSFI